MLEKWLLKKLFLNLEANLFDDDDEVMVISEEVTVVARVSKESRPVKNRDKRKEGGKK